MGDTNRKGGAMKNELNPEDDPLGDGLLTVDEVAGLLRVSPRKVLMLPIKQFRIGPRLVRYRLADVYSFIDVENPNL
jgi:hypothetical protein